MKEEDEETEISKERIKQKHKKNRDKMKVDRQIMPCIQYMMDQIKQENTLNSASLLNVN